MKIDVSEAIHLLKHGQVVALPTETVYGLAARLEEPVAIEKIFSLKGRPTTNPLIIHVLDIAQIKKYAEEIPPSFEKLAKAFWPGPMTLILPIKEHLIPSIVRANLGTAGFRIPHQSDTLEVIQHVGPLVMPSANLSGKPSATSASHVEKDFGSDFPVLEGNDCKKGVESTILMYLEDKWKILRLGSLTAEQLLSV